MINILFSKRVFFNFHIQFNDKKCKDEKSYNKMWIKHYKIKLFYMVLRIPKIIFVSHLTYYKIKCI
jgi:hypothetical protein